ncbi:hypothetical protein A2643_02065 [Candidatus Nomurabacteria bacterium RIFCSPHIGHO2_01_FULL_39_220]|uniref:Uncharacterized protein n=1 Tax=Candidatus Nomurabacteria bacterium RIFCSPLOWO2_02_FULL_40_67 TaxID=1801787 RepID=A0A1F6Y4U1_9BACT|nr:MAG: hypothetical protein UU01_C0010G0006 [Parcubacteria group bacterium GW2011_GWA2_40_37]KKS14221.1 MAG: hypothetical protein UU71_C0031G0006 [Parcubacteria group bacterium GW2011_GWB1_41_6]KKS72406.1 MAG: hypothetical protein UV43_C0017G0006 [Parcubacteria group bacterium GW2011_GWF2_42_7]OGI63137.1 MAG: hypothetical protein A2W12_04170 [Candidatus Nomurabacteria bacterium RBG_16_40_11]OGI69883.1 MAG: hypothetical protein A2643_02065 [Candidatus Nomurabacteria bacterium RIFCSPHIGHO2_01_FU
MKIHFPKKEKSSEINIRPYWNIIFSLGFVLTLAAFVFGFYFFRQINRESVGEANRPSLHGKTVKKERIEKILEYFAFKKQTSNQILNSPAPIDDPSL